MTMERTIKIILPIINNVNNKASAKEMIKKKLKILLAVVNIKEKAVGLMLNERQNIMNNISSNNISSSSNGGRGILVRLQKIEDFY